MVTDLQLQEKYKQLLPYLDEKTSRLYLASEALSLGRGGKVKVSKLAGVSRVRINKGISELESSISDPSNVQVHRIRKEGGGRKPHKQTQIGLIDALDRIVNPHTLGDPMNPLLWTSKSLRKIEKALKSQGYTIGYVTIGELLKTMGYSLQSNKKTDEGGHHVDRDAQFEYINQTALSYMEQDAPVISVDCKKKELIGNYKNSGVEWHQKGKAPNVKVYDFIDRDLGKAVPYGVYDQAKNQGWVSVGISKDTAEFAVNTIRTWWQSMGNVQYRNTHKLLITADCGGSNSSRSRLWKKQLQRFATQTGLQIKVCHYPPGTSKWNKIEHRLFSFISKNWRGKPLESLEVIVQLIANTTTQKGLKVNAKADKTIYQKGIKISDKELSEIKLERDDFRGEWNYNIYP